MDADKIIDRVKSLSAERDRLIAILELWRIVEKEGINIDDVRTFTFRPEFLKGQEFRSYELGTYASRRDASKFWLNCVRLKNDTLHPIPLTKRPRECTPTL